MGNRNTSALDELALEYDASVRRVIELADADPSTPDGAAELRREIEHACALAQRHEQARLGIDPTQVPSGPAVITLPEQRAAVS